jgi:transposase
MARSLSLADHLSTEVLQQRMRQATEARLRTHYQVIYLKSQGQSVPQIAETVGYCQNWVRSLIHRYNEHGEAGLFDQRTNNPGRLPLLDAAQQAELEHLLAERHEDGGLNGPKVARWMAQKTGREAVYAQQGWAYLRRLGFTAQAPRRRHVQADAEEQQAFKKSSPNALETALR